MDTNIRRGQHRAMSRGPSYAALVGRYAALQADMAAWPADDERRLIARQELAAIERQMAVLATHGLTCPCCSDPAPADFDEMTPQEMGVVLYGNFRRPHNT
jgi:hypothetical protein